MSGSILSEVGELNTSSFHGYNVKFSPILGNFVAVAASENFGIEGRGALIIYDLGKGCSSIFGLAKYPACLYDLTWCDANPELVLTCSIDSYIQLWNLRFLEEPIANIKAHICEVSSVSWCPYRNDVFSSTSWDSTVKLWNFKTLSPVAVLSGHRAIVYEANWCRSDPYCLASVSGDGTLIWDPIRSPHPIMAFPSTQGIEVLTCDWSNTCSSIFATASSDCLVKVWDLRHPSVPLSSMLRHMSPVRRLRFSPVLPYEFVTVSYDFTTRLWDMTYPDPLCSSLSQHTEFVYGVDYDRLVPGRIADCAWDRTIKLYHIIPNLNRYKSELPSTSAHSDIVVANMPLPAAIPASDALSVNASAALPSYQPFTSLSAESDSKL